MKKPKKAHTQAAAAALAAGGPKANIPDMFDPILMKPVPVANYRLFSTLTMNGTMDQKDSVTWECWVQYDPKTGLPAFRRTAWLVGDFRDPAGAGNWPANPVDLHDMGAQHRDSIVYLRVVSADANAKVMKVEDNYGAVQPPVEADKIQAGRFKDFYVILPSHPLKRGAGVRFDSRYLLQSNDRDTRLEVCYEAHPPGEVTAQVEDGGPPCIPPIQEN